MGKITVQVHVTNVFDWYDLRMRRIGPEEVRFVSVPDAVVDTGATMFSLPINLIEDLRLPALGTTQVRTANGRAERRVFGGARVEIMGRHGIFDVVELPADTPALIGYIVLERLDLYPDPVNRTLTGRPDSPDHMVIECYESNMHPHHGSFPSKRAWAGSHGVG